LVGIVYFAVHLNSLVSI